ncbi:ribosome quality control complex subunit TCF25 isoform X3 [Denticeps clupeoides]|uniref:ribosome quality control complex subunit TCF25 isoform X3 n=1 Tax=Denticeps clupeoides TaxID=299321 RepID=UPI0010A39537|nr:transcription factor 25 isoform X3 [Denticeps clupeoides]
MSSRALRRLKGKQRGQEALSIEDLKLDEGQEEAENDNVDEEVSRSANTAGRKSKKHKMKKNISNIYELICNAESEKDDCITDDENTHKQSKTDPRDFQTRKDGGLNSGQEKGKKKKKKKKAIVGDLQQKDRLGDDIDSVLATLDKSNGVSHQTEGSTRLDSRPILYVEHRNLNPDTELKRYFGARAVMGDQRPRQRQRQYHRSTWMTFPKDTWPHFSKPGISMSLLESRDGLQYFTFEHNRDYQQVQFKFLDAVESMDPNNIIVLLQLNPYHIDSLLQLSDVCRLQEDQEMAKDLIERALYSFECAFHPVFSLTSGTSRLDYRRPENRAFYLALFKHMMFLERRGCPRTALEFCKLILNLDPENDPLCMLLLVDFLCLRCREYAALIRLFEEWEAHRNLSQLPNFAFSVALSHFHLSQKEEEAERLEESQRHRHQSNGLLQNALIMFPSVLMPLLDLCTVQPDSAVSSHQFFGPKSCLGQPPALAELVSLYVGRIHGLWKESGVLLWLEENVHGVLSRVNEEDPLVEDCIIKRKVRYQSCPRNIHRHVILSEIKEAISSLPLEVTTQPMMGFDPLPPLDSVPSHSRPERQNAGASNESTLSTFFRSLLPNFNVQGLLKLESFIKTLPPYGRWSFVAGLYILLPG